MSWTSCIFISCLTSTMNSIKTYAKWQSKIYNVHNPLLSKHDARLKSMTRPPFCIPTSLCVFVRRSCKQSTLVLFWTIRNISGCIPGDAGCLHSYDKDAVSLDTVMLFERKLNYVLHFEKYFNNALWEILKRKQINKLKYKWE